MLREFVDQIPKEFLHEPGAAFYSGRRAFSKPSDLYILGANPEGNPDDDQDASVSRNVQHVLYEASEDWSAYRDDNWGPKCNKSRLQRGVLHLFEKLQLNPGEVPASEVVFLPPKSLASLGLPFNWVAEKCWPFHLAVIYRLGVKVIVCIGKDAGLWVRRRLNAETQIDEFVESNERRWKSVSHRSADGLIVVTLTHPSQANWDSKASDPTTLVKRALIRTDTEHRKIYMERRLMFKPIRIKGEMISDTVIEDREDRV